MEESQTPPLAVDEDEGEEYWKEQLERFKTFPGSAREYCKQNNLRYGRFYRYKKKLGFIKTRKAPQKAFVQIKTIEPAVEKEPKVKTLSRSSNLSDPKWVAQFLKEFLGQ
jgi:hypothetical protein